MEVVDHPRSVLTRIPRSKVPNDFIKAKDLDLVKVVIAELVVETEAEAELLQTLAELMLTPSFEL
jgi:hypothetical protein